MTRILAIFIITTSLISCSQYIKKNDLVGSWSYNLGLADEKKSEQSYLKLNNDNTGEFGIVVFSDDKIIKTEEFYELTYWSFNNDSILTVNYENELGKQDNSWKIKSIIDNKMLATPYTKELGEQTFISYTYTKLN